MPDTKAAQNELLWQIVAKTDIKNPKKKKMMKSDSSVSAISPFEVFSMPDFYAF